MQSSKILQNGTEVQHTHYRCSKCNLNPVYKLNYLSTYLGQLDCLSHHFLCNVQRVLIPSVIALLVLNCRLQKNYCILLAGDRRTRFQTVLVQSLRYWLFSKAFSIFLGRPTYLSADLGFTAILYSFIFFSPATLRTRWMEHNQNRQHARK